MKGAAGCIIKKDGKFLFAKRSEKEDPYPNMWSLPSGTAEKDEKLFEMAKREMMEELGINIDIIKIAGFGYNEEKNTIFALLFCTTEDMPEILEPNEIAEIKWMTITDFFKNHDDEELPFGLRYMRKHPEIWRDLE